jgi:hypothetical protein
MPPQSVYFFGEGSAEGTKEMKAILGGKGANLAEMTNLGVPVPPGFTVACALCIAYLRDRQAPESLKPELDAALRRLERVAGKVFGDASNPLLVSVRSGSPVSMPAMTPSRGSHGRAAIHASRTIPIDASFRCTGTSSSASRRRRSSNCCPASE